MRNGVSGLSVSSRLDGLGLTDLGEKLEQRSIWI